MEYLSSLWGWILLYSPDYSLTYLVLRLASAKLSLTAMADVSELQVDFLICWLSLLVCCLMWLERLVCFLSLMLRRCAPLFRRH